MLLERIKKAGEILGIKLLDHVIVGELGNYSFANAGRLPLRAAVLSGKPPKFA